MPSTFTRNGDPSQGGFGSVLARLFGVLGRGVADYRDYQRFGPDYKAKQRADEIAQQKAEIGLKRDQAALDYEPIKADQGRLQNARDRAAYAKALMEIVGNSLQGQEGQTEDAPLPQAGIFDTMVPAGTGPLAIGSRPREPVPPQLSPADVEASGMPLESIIAGGRGLQEGSAMQREILRLQQRRENTAAQAEQRRLDRESREGFIEFDDPAHPGHMLRVPRAAVSSTVSGEYGLRKQAEKPPPSPARGSFREITDEKGNILTYFNPASGETSAPPVAGRKSGLAGTELTRRAGLEGMVEDLGTLADLANRHRDSIGRFSGTLAAIQRQTVGADPEVNDLFRLSDNLADQLLRARSGAQINEQEYSRLRSLVPNPRLPESKFFSDLKAFTFELQRLQSRTSGGPTTPIPTRGGGAPTVPTPEHGPPVNKRENPKGSGRYEYIDAQGRTWRQ